MAASRIAEVVRRSALKKQTGTVIILHGAGDTGTGSRDWFDGELKRTWNFDHLDLLFPTAAPMFYQPFQCMMNVWFDRKGFNITDSEDLPTTDLAMKAVYDIIAEEEKKGIASDRIIVGGFSQGASLSLHMGYRGHSNLAGVFALSGFLYDESSVYQTLQGDSTRWRPPLFQCHGTSDDVIPYSYGEATHSKLTSHGVTGNFYKLPSIQHELHRKTLEKLDVWIKSILP